MGDIEKAVQEEMYRQGRRQPTTPFIEDVASVAEKTAKGVKIVGKGVGNLVGDVTMKGITTGGVAGAGASDYFLGTNLMPTAGKAFEKAWNLPVPTNVPASGKPLAKGSNLPAFDTKLKKGEDPNKVAQDIASGIRNPVGDPSRRGMIAGDQGTRPQEPDINAQVDALVNQLMNAPESRVTQSMGLQPNERGIRTEQFRTGGIKKKVLDQVTELRKAQLGLAGHKMTAAEAHDLRRQHLDQLRVQNEGILEEKRLARQEGTAAKKEGSFQKKLVAISPPGAMDETGKTQPNWQAGLLDLMDQGHSPQDMPGYEEAARSLWDKRESAIMAEFERKDLAYNPADINKRGTVTYKGRQELMRKMRAALLGKEPKE